MFNSDADVSMQQKADASWWITVTYPQFSNATLYLTLSPVSRRETSAIMDNRRERMELNSGGATTVITELTSAGNWHCELAETRTSLTTPCSFLPQIPPPCSPAPSTLICPQAPHPTQ